MIKEMLGASGNERLVITLLRNPSYSVCYLYSSNDGKSLFTSFG